MYRLKFEFENNNVYDNEKSYITKVEKEFYDFGNGEFPTLLYEIANSLMACGFSRELIKEYIDIDI